MVSAECPREADFELFRISLARQPLPEGSLALKILEDGPGTAQVSLSVRFAGWPAAYQKSYDNGDGAIATLTQQEVCGDATALEFPSTATRTTSKWKRLAMRR
jgi:hypothetical protein